MEEKNIAKEAKDFINKKVDDANSEGTVIGLSGGIDSATTLKLAVNALGKEKVTALIMPGKPSKEENMEDATALAEELGVETQKVKIQEIVKNFQGEFPFEPEKEGLGNIRARIRMTYLYAFANERNLLVLGTGNRTEYLLGYFTKYGDGATDISPLLDLYKTEVKKLAEHIDLDQKFIQKKPTAGLWEGQTDEEEIGTNYETIDEVLQVLIDEKMEVEKTVEKTGVERETVENLQSMHRDSQHKREGSQGLKLHEK